MTDTIVATIINAVTLKLQWCMWPQPHRRNIFDDIIAWTLFNVSFTFFFCSRVLANRLFYLCPDLVLFESNVQMVSFTRQLNYSEPPAPISRCQLLSAASTKCPGQSAPMYTTTGRNNVKLSTEHLWMRFFK